jgi:DNA end-binding protein Ku
MASRPVWKGSIQFSMVSVPVRAYTAGVSGGSGIAFNQLHAECHSRIKYQKVCPIHGEVRANEIISGYEFADGQYVIVEAEEIEKLRPAKDKAVRIAGFLKSDVIDPRYFSGKTYYLVPEGVGAPKPYVLLQRVLKGQNRVAFAQLVISGHEQIVLLRPVDNLIVMTFLNYASEIKPPAEFTDEVPGVEVSQKELDLAKTLTTALAMEDFDLSQYRDNYADNLRKLVEAKIEGREIVTPTEEDVPTSPTINLMEALQKSLNDVKKGTKQKPPKLASPSIKPAAKEGRRRKTS